MNLKNEDLLSVSLREKLYRMKITLPLMFISLNILNVIDKALTWVALKSPEIGELNPIVRYAIGRFGVTTTMLLYTIVGFVLLYVTYRVLTAKRSFCEKNNMPPEGFFIVLNVIFCIIVINNLFWSLR